MDLLLVNFRTGLKASLQAIADWQDQVEPALASFIEGKVPEVGASLGSYNAARARLWDQVRKAFEQVDVLALPTMPTAGYRLGHWSPDNWRDRPDGASRWIAMTALFNLTGQPAASLPCGFASNGVPVGLQLVGDRFADWTILRLSKTFEEISPWSDRWPTA
jgi:aspartyl-tRNA(Asn)/glutamyl-tRNA(Gln) amidotransferase subunit A